MGIFSSYQESNSRYFWSLSVIPSSFRLPWLECMDTIVPIDPAGGPCAHPFAPKHNHVVASSKKLLRAEFLNLQALANLREELRHAAGQDQSVGHDRDGR
jgi:hypothetical protein